jgi:hypothetical protein
MCKRRDGMRSRAWFDMEVSLGTSSPRVVSEASRFCRAFVAGRLVSRVTMSALLLTLPASSSATRNAFHSPRSAAIGCVISLAKRGPLGRLVRGTVVPRSGLSTEPCAATRFTLALGWLGGKCASPTMRSD